MHPRLIVGLGNPGKRYSLTRHNLGFRVVEQMAREKGIGPAAVWKNSMCAHGYLNGQKIIIAQPLTYMNRSGIAVAELVRYFKLSVDNILVVYDDLDLNPGAIRLRSQGGSGGHNGAASIISELGTDQFNRLRLGIGRPCSSVDGVADSARYVLMPFAPEEEKVISKAVACAVEAAVTFVEEGIDAAMCKFNCDAR